jgi:hypothetical protein
MRFVRFLREKKDARNPAFFSAIAAIAKSMNSKIRLKWSLVLLILRMRISSQASNILPQAL